MQNNSSPSNPNPSSGIPPVSPSAPSSAGIPPVSPNPNLGAAAVNATITTSTPGGSVVESVKPNPNAFSPSAPGMTPINATSASVISPASPTPIENHRGRMIETIILIIVSLIAVTFIGLFIWKYLEWDSINTDVEGRIDAAIAVAVSENTTKLEDAFVEREKYPYKSFMGPADYGSVSFEYPKTWNLYIAKDASSGGDYEAYLNPGEVLPVSNTTINALRFTIQSKAFDSVVKSYESSVKNGKLAITTRNIGGTVANIYTGEISNNIRGIVTIFKVRDKTVILQTDSELFADEYYKLLDTVSFVE